MLSQGEATLRSTFYFLNTEGCRGKRAVQARAAKGGWGVPAPRFGSISTPMINRKAAPSPMIECLSQDLGGVTLYAALHRPTDERLAQ